MTNPDVVDVAAHQLPVHGEGVRQPKTVRTQLSVSKPPSCVVVRIPADAATRLGQSRRRMVRSNAYQPPSSGTVAVIRRSITLFVPWAAVLILSSALAYAVNASVVGASTNSSQAVQSVVVSPAVTSQELLGDAQLDAPGCLAVWGFLAAERPEIYAAGFEQFVENGCIAPWVPRPAGRLTG